MMFIFLCITTVGYICILILISSVLVYLLGTDNFPFGKKVFLFLLIVSICALLVTPLYGVVDNKLNSSIEKTQTNYQELELLANDSSNISDEIKYYSYDTANNCILCQTNGEELILNQEDVTIYEADDCPPHLITYVVSTKPEMSETMQKILFFHVIPTKWNNAYEIYAP